MAAKLATAELIESLCTKLGHKTDAGPSIKKIVTENWLDKADDLRYVPKTRLETWGVPLKLIDEIYDFLAETEADDTVRGLNHFVNYTLRPTVSWILPTTKAMDWVNDSYLREKDPELWAALKIQHRFRRRKLLRQREAEAKERKNDEVLYDGESGDIKRASEEQRYQVRKKRAEAKLRMLIPRWRERRQRRLRDGGTGISESKFGFGDIASMVMTEAQDAARAKHEELFSAPDCGKGTIACHLLKASRATLKNCEVTRALKKISRELGKTEIDVIPVIHRLVTLNWIEDLDDLDVVADRHWDAWKIPEKIVVQLKSMALEQTEDKVSGGFKDFTDRVKASVCGWFF
jgi:hypothetical protein